MFVLENLFTTKKVWMIGNCSLENIKGYLLLFEIWIMVPFFPPVNISAFTIILNKFLIINLFPLL